MCDDKQLGLEEDLMKDLEQLSDLHFNEEDYSLQINQHIVLEDSSDSYQDHDNEEAACSTGVLSTRSPECLPSSNLSSVVNEIKESLIQNNILCSEEGFTSQVVTPPTERTVRQLTSKDRRVKQPKGFLKKIENDWKPAPPVKDFQVKREDFPAL